MRAARLVHEFSLRGWRCVMCNFGPFLDDPKIDAIRGRAVLDELELGTSKALRAHMSGFDPDVVVMGEGPMEAMKPSYEAARDLPRPFVVLDQFYNNWLLPLRDGVDLCLLYGLRSFWGEELVLGPPYEIVPPFIDEVTPRERLPVPAPLHALPWVTLVAYEPVICERGLETIARASCSDTALIIVSRDPERSARLALAKGIAESNLVSLPLQPDPDIFGLLGASSVALVSNGFLQIMECLAMGTPVITLPRDLGIGMCQLNVAEQFLAYVSLNESSERQAERLAEWVAADPFDPALKERLSTERHGISYSVNRIEELARRYQWEQEQRAKRKRGWARVFHRQGMDR